MYICVYIHVYEYVYTDTIFASSLAWTNHESNLAGSSSSHCSAEELRLIPPQNRAKKSYNTYSQTCKHAHAHTNTFTRVHTYMLTFILISLFI